MFSTVRVTIVEKTVASLSSTAPSPITALDRPAQKGTISVKQYLDLLGTIMSTGVERGDRTGTGTIGLFGQQMRFDLRDGFPLMTTKRVPLRLVAVELLWFVQGRTDKQWLTDRNCHIWDEWSAPGHPDHIGPGYGWQWRNFGADYDPAHTAGWQPGTHGVDQLAKVIDGLRLNPEGRRHIISAWNPEEVDNMALPPCHTMFQFFVSDRRLHCHLYQRSCDMFLGVPFNIASYSLLTHIIAREVGLGVGEFIWTGGDCHIYLNHIEQVEEQLSREPKPLPTLVMSDAPREPGDILPRYTEHHFSLDGYNPAPAIKAPVAA